MTRSYKEKRHSMTSTKVLLTGLGILALTASLAAQERAPRGGGEQAQPRHQAPQVQQQAPPPPQMSQPRYEAPPAQQRPSPERYMMNEGRGRGMMGEGQMRGRMQDQNRGQASQRTPGATYGWESGQGRGQMIRPPQSRPGAMRGPGGQAVPRGMMGGPGYPMGPRGRVLPRNDRPRWPLYEQRRHRAFRWNLGLGGLYLGEMGYYGNYPIYPYQSYYESGSFGHLKFKGCPRDAGVLIDNGFAGLIDSADGLWQSIVAEVGTHIINVVFDEAEVAQFNVYVAPYQTMTLRCQ